jgi:hypothetical protein
MERIDQISVYFPADMPQQEKANIWSAIRHEGIDAGGTVPFYSNGFNQTHVNYLQGKYSSVRIVWEPDPYADLYETESPGTITTIQRISEGYVPPQAVERGFYEDEPYQYVITHPEVQIPGVSYQPAPEDVATPPVSSTPGGAGPAPAPQGTEVIVSTPEQAAQSSALGTLALAAAGFFLLRGIFK